MKSSVLLSLIIGALYGASLLNNPGVVPLEALVRGALAVVTVFMALLVFKFVFALIRGTYRAVTGFDAHRAARTAGAVTGAVQRKTSTIAQSFKDGLKGD